MDLLHTGLIGAGVTGAIALFSQLKSAVERFIGIFIVSFSVTHDAAEAVSAYIWKNGKVIRWGPRFFRAYSEYVKKLRSCVLIPIEQFTGKSTIIFIGNKPLWLTAGHEHMEPIRQAEVLTISFFRFTFDPEKLIQDALAAINETQKAKKERFRVIFKSGMGSIHARNGKLNYGGKDPSDLASSPTSSVHSEVAHSVYQGTSKLIGYQLNEIGYSTNKAPFDVFAFDDYILEAIKEIQFWKEHQNWFKDRSIPWRMGWLFNGEPGTGKTTLVRCIGQHFDLPVIVFDIASMSNGEFEREWDELSHHSPCIALIEDIDRVFNKDVNVLGEQGGGLSFDKLLNCISGIKICDGIFTIITTNHIEKVDPALGIAQKSGISTRPGRMDRVITVVNPSERCRRKIAERILDKFPLEIEAVVKAGELDTAAQFQDRCCQRALTLFWASYK